MLEKTPLVSSVFTEIKSDKYLKNRRRMDFGLSPKRKVIGHSKFEAFSPQSSPQSNTIEVKSPAVGQLLI